MPAPAGPGGVDLFALRRFARFGSWLQYKGRCDRVSGCFGRRGHPHRGWAPLPGPSMSLSNRLPAVFFLLLGCLPGGGYADTAFGSYADKIDAVFAAVDRKDAPGC